MAKKDKKLILAYFTVAKGGKVRISGLDEAECTPKALEDVLEKYGFLNDVQSTWIDAVGPYDTLYENLEILQAKVPFALMFDKKKVICHIRGSKPAKASEIELAMSRSFTAWNKAGRPIGRVTIQEALASALVKINAERG